MKLSTVVIFLALGVTVNREAVAQTAQVPDALRSYIETALDQNPDVMATRAEWKNADAKVDEARSSLIPHFDFISRYTGFSGGRILSFPGVGTFNATALGIVPWDNHFELSWPILNYGIWNGMSASESFRDASTAQVSAKELDVVEKVTEAYYNFAKASELLEVRKNADTLASENLRTAQALFTNDKAPKNDVLRAEVGVASAEGDLLSARNNATMAQSYFNNLLKRDFGSDINVPKSSDIAAIVFSGGDIATTDGSALSSTLPSLHDDADKAFATRPEVAQLLKTSQAIEDSKRSAWSDYLPNIAVFASYGWQENTLQFSSNADVLIGGLQLQWNFFTGFATKAKVQEQEAQLEELHFQTESAMNNIRLELENARLEKVNASSRLAIGKKQVASADENYRIVKAQYDNGLAPLITLIDAQTTLASAKAYYTTTTYDVLIADAKYKKALGIR